MQKKTRDRLTGELAFLNDRDEWAYPKRFEKLLAEYQISSAGVDEVGRGCLAGPVYAGAVVLNWGKLKKVPRKHRALLRDSKTLSRLQRLRAIEIIAEISIAKAVGEGSVAEIETLGILGATFLAMRRALGSLGILPSFVLIDGHLSLPDIMIPQLSIVKGDDLCASIACASIIAKEARDDFMRYVGKEFPNYGFEQHVGYGTKLHLEAISNHGICVHHRRNFSPVRNSL